MPTPFTHLYAAQAALDDPRLPQRALLVENQAAYLLGSVVADAHFLAKLRRDETHFYTYDHPITTPPWRVMFDKYPTLWNADADDQRAFLAGYAFHLSMDEVWTRDMLGEFFAHGEWGTRQQRFLMLHVMLIGMDERDLAKLDERSVSAMASMTTTDTRPGEWLPFMNAATCREWGALIHRQIKPGGHSETFDIIAPRVGMTPEQLREVQDDHARAERELWAHIPHATLAEIEVRMVNHAHEQMAVYLEESAPV